ncbi:uncharacterized protein LOC106175750 [Lingula anatina]|uniref:Uncharacterized protein LOC106175750 n=1 Tax=Lingula anatina TaxID=7574 RepID=A0A1S3JSN4_LINAN|nr:uncharacterized protein LOC106175750 [Lingula anatina]|eukprot:XP_013413332.1 uncharacterized protein LOC106175750 [Lingula anatina]
MQNSRQFEAHDKGQVKFSGNRGKKLQQRLKEGIGLTVAGTSDHDSVLHFPLKQSTLQAPTTLFSVLEEEEEDGEETQDYRVRSKSFGCMDDYLSKRRQGIKAMPMSAILSPRILRRKNAPRYLLTVPEMEPHPRRRVVSALPASQHSPMLSPDASPKSTPRSTPRTSPRSTPRDSPGGSTHVTPLGSTEKLWKTGFVPKRQNWTGGTLKQSNIGGSLPNLSTDTYIDRCLNALSPVNFGVGRPPLPHGSRPFQMALRDLAQERDRCQETKSNLVQSNGSKRPNTDIIDTQTKKQEVFSNMLDTETDSGYKIDKCENGEGHNQKHVGFMEQGRHIPTFASTDDFSDLRYMAKSLPDISQLHSAPERQTSENKFVKKDKAVLKQREQIEHRHALPVVSSPRLLQRPAIKPNSLV